MNLASEKIKDFTDLLAWQKVHILALNIYKVSENFPQSEIFGITPQIRRASVSLSAQKLLSGLIKGAKEYA